MTENVLKPDKSDPAWSCLALSLIPRIGYKKIWDLIEHLGSIEDLLKTSPEILIEQFQISSKLANLISKATQSHSFNIEKWETTNTPTR
jgi:ERCC4-type nuclease